MGNDDSKKLILARRARFVAAALASGAGTVPLVVGAGACGGETEEQSPQPCLSMDAATTRNDAEPQPCLSMDAAPDDAEPQPCLAPRLPDAGADGASDGGPDAEPQPCLFAPMDDGG